MVGVAVSNNTMKRNIPQGVYEGIRLPFWKINFLRTVLHFLINAPSLGTPCHFHKTRSRFSIIKIAGMNYQSKQKSRESCISLPFSPLFFVLGKRSVLEIFFIEKRKKFALGFKGVGILWKKIHLSSFMSISSFRDFYKG